MVSCAACGFSKSPNATRRGISFHKFPRNEERRELWINFLGKNKPQCSKCIYLCSQHFNESCFDRSLGRIRLQDDAIPTIEIQRLKYARSHDIHVKVPQQKVLRNIAPAPQPAFVAIPLMVPIRSTEPINNSLTVSAKNTLKRLELRDQKEIAVKNLLQSKKIRVLQQSLRRHQKTIEHLSFLSKELIQKCIQNGESEETLLRSFSSHHKLVKSLLGKINNLNMNQKKTIESHPTVIEIKKEPDIGDDIFEVNSEGEEYVTEFILDDHNYC